MKKGFLSGDAPSKSKDLVEISCRKSDGKKDFRILDEVQQVIKEEQQAKSEATCSCSHAIIDFASLPR